MSLEMDVSDYDYDYDLSRRHAFADLRGIAWRPILALAEFEATEIPEEVENVEIIDPSTFLQSLTRDPSVGGRIPPHRRTPMTFANFTRELFEPYILREVTKRFHEAEASMEHFVEEKQILWQNQMVASANQWMKIQQTQYRKLALSDQMIRARLSALELAAQQGYSIDSENDVVMRAAPALPLAIEPPPQYAAEMAAVMLHEEMRPFLTQVAQHSMEQQARVEQLEAQLQVLIVPQPPPLTVAFEKAMRDRGVSPTISLQNLRQKVQRSGVSKSRSRGSRQSSRQPSPQPPPSAPEIVPAPPAETLAPSTPAIRLDPVRPFAVAGSTPIPATPRNPPASASAQVPAAPAKPSAAGWSGFPGPSAQSATAYCSDGCRVVGGEGSEFHFSHRMPCQKGRYEAILLPAKTKPQATPKMKKSRCTYCESTRHGVIDCADYRRDYPVPQRAASQPPPPPPPPSHPETEQMEEDEADEERFDGYDMPGGAQGGNTGGAGGGQPPRGGNVAGGDDPGDSDSSSSDSDGSDSSPPDPRDFLGRPKAHWSRERREKYDRRCRALKKFIQKSQRAKKSSHKPRKPEKLGVDPFTGDPKDTQRFIHDVEIKLEYFRESLKKEIDKVSLVIPLLKDGAKEWYKGIHPYINKEGAERHGIPFDPKNALRTWKGFRERLEGSFGGWSDRNQSLREWGALMMKPGKTDRYIDDLIRLAARLGYDGDFVKDKARVGMTRELNAAWSLKTPHPTPYIEYLNLLRLTGHQLEDAANFEKSRDHPHHEKRQDKHVPEKRQRKEKKATGPRQPRPNNQASGSSRPPESEHSKMHRNVPQTLIDKRKRLNQCSRCGQEGHFWKKCSQASPVVMSSKPHRKRNADDAGLKSRTVPKTRRIEAAPAPAVRQAVTELRGSPPLKILEVDTDMED
jgi:hypothetical protein